MCIAHNNCMSCPSIRQTLSALLINILLGSFQLFLHSDQPLSEGENNPVQRCLPVGGRLHYPRRRRCGFTTDLIDCFDVQPTTTSGNIITQSIISVALASANSFVYFSVSSAATSRRRTCMAKNCRVRQLQFSGIFVALGL